VVDPPTTPRSPVAPNRPLLLFGVLVIGIGAGVATAFALGQLRATFATTAKLEKAAGLPVLGSISQVLTEAAQAARRRQLKFFLAGTGALGGLFVLLMAAEFVQRGMVA
jgi:heme/copper-type cytochrome/quinol oxidase subunit 3